MVAGVTRRFCEMADNVWALKELEKDLWLKETHAPLVARLNFMKARSTQQFAFARNVKLWDGIQCLVALVLGKGRNAIAVGTIPCTRHTNLRH